MIAVNRLHSSWLGNREAESIAVPTMADLRQSAQSQFEAYPVGAVFAAFGLGLTLGMALVHLFEQEHKPSRMWS